MSEKMQENSSGDKGSVEQDASQGAAEGSQAPLGAGRFKDPWDKVQIAAKHIGRQVLEETRHIGDLFRRGVTQDWEVSPEQQHMVENPVLQAGPEPSAASVQQQKWRDDIRRQREAQRQGPQAEMERE